MKTFLALLLAGVASPVLAEQGMAQTPSAAAPAAGVCLPEHAAMGHCTLPPPALPPQTPSPAPVAVCLPEHAAMGHCTLPVAPPPAAPATPCSPEHAALGHCTLPAPKSEPPTPPVAPTGACLPEHAAMGHCTLPARPPQPVAAPAPSAPDCSPEHAAMGHCTLIASLPPVAPPPADALTGPENAADAVYGTGAMALAREVLRREHGDIPAHKTLIDRLEARVHDGTDSYLADIQAWYGGDIDKFWLKSELEGAWNHGIEEAEAQALWSHAINPWFDLQTGVRYDARPGPDRTHLIVGVQGLAPYWFEVEGALFLSSKGDITARAEAEHDVRITQKLILQPRAELNFSLQDVPEIELGSGVTNVSLGARLRYQIVPAFAPYVGVEYDRAIGDTARFRRVAGESPGGWNLVLGVRTWF